VIYQFRIAALSRIGRGCDLPNSDARFLDIAVARLMLSAVCVGNLVVIANASLSIALYVIVTLIGVIGPVRSAHVMLWPVRVSYSSHRGVGPRVTRRSRHRSSKRAAGIVEQAEVTAGPLDRLMRRYPDRVAIAAHPNRFGPALRPLGVERATSFTIDR